MYRFKCQHFYKKFDKDMKPTGFYCNYQNTEDHNMRCELCPFFHLNFKKVKELVKARQNFGFSIGDKVKLKDGVFYYADGSGIPRVYRVSPLYIQQINKDNTVRLSFFNSSCAIAFPKDVAIGDICKV